MRRINNFPFRIGLLMGLFSLIAFAASTPLRADDNGDAGRARRAAEVMREVMSAPDSGIPHELLEKAKAIAVIPHVVKGAFFVGGSFGKGLVSERTADGGWSTPSFVDLSGGSFGFQFGAEATDYVLVFTNAQGIDPLLKGKVELGADASIAAGPVGRSAKAGTGVQLKSAIYSYSRSKGAFVGVALNGDVLSIDNSANRKVYGRDVTAQDILIKQDVRPNGIVRPFMDTLDKYARFSKG